MTIDYFRHFIIIVEAGSILAASSRLRIAQPALSAQLKRMENTCGTDLLIRGPRNVTLTETGKIFYKKAKSIVALADETQEEINNCMNGSTGTLSLALPPTNSDAFIRKLLDTFMKKYPQIRYSIHEATSQETADVVASGLAEIGFIRAPIADQSSFHMFPLQDEPIGAVLPKSLVTTSSPMTFKELLRYELCVSRGAINVVKEECRKQNITPTIFAITGSLSVAISIAKLRRCVALIPSQYRNAMHKDMTFVEITDNNLALSRAFIVKKGAPISKVGKLFLKEMDIADKS